MDNISNIFALIHQAHVRINISQYGHSSSKSHPVFNPANSSPYISPQSSMGGPTSSLVTAPASQNSSRQTLKHSLQLFMGPRFPGKNSVILVLIFIIAFLALKLLFVEDELQSAKFSTKLYKDRYLELSERQWEHWKTVYQLSSCQASARHAAGLDM